MSGQKTSFTPVPGEIVVRPESNQAGAEPSEFDFADALAIDAEIARVSTELGDDLSESKVQIWRVQRDTRQLALIMELLPSEFSMKRLIEDCGGGVFNIKVYVPAYDENGTRRGVKLLKNPRIVVEGEPRIYRRPEVLPASVAPAAGASDVLMEFLREQRAFNERVINAMSGQRSLKDQLEEFAALRTLLVPTVAPTPPPEDGFKQFERFMTLYDRIRPPLADVRGTGDTGMMIGIAKEFFSMMREQRRIQAEAPAVPAAVPFEDAAAGGAVAGEPAAVVQPVAPVPGAQPEEGDPVKIFYTAFVSKLAQAARANEDVVPYAKTILAEASDEFIEMLKGMTDEQALDWLAQFNKDVKLFPVWFKRLREKMVELDNANPTPAV